MPYAEAHQRMADTKYQELTPEIREGFGALIAAGRAARLEDAAKIRQHLAQHGRSTSRKSQRAPASRCMTRKPVPI